MTGDGGFYGNNFLGGGGAEPAVSFVLSSALAAGGGAGAATEAMRGRLLSNQREAVTCNVSKDEHSGGLTEV